MWKSRISLQGTCYAVILVVAFAIDMIHAKPVSHFKPSTEDGVKNRRENVGSFFTKSPFSILVLLVARRRYHIFSSQFIVT